MKKDFYNIYEEEDASQSDHSAIQDDEDIDEDLVFNESDEERFGSHFDKKIQDSDIDASDDALDDDDQEHLDQLIKRENLQNLINPMHQSEMIDLPSDSESDGSIKDLSNILHKKRKIYDLNVKQGEFAVPVKGKVSINDLMQSVQEETSFGALKKKLKGLENTQILDAPAATRIKKRVERIAAYEEANKKISKWTPIVKKNREAEHLVFEEEKGINITSAALVGQFNPSTDMELEIQNLIKASGMGETDVASKEELELVKISKDQVIQRQKELSKMRALCFFKEQKQKKIAKIKSKVYRKLHRKKDKKALEMDLQDLERLDPELARERVEKLELERAKERVSLKHKNTSAWAKQMLRRSDGDPETRIALMKNLEKHNQLKKKIIGNDESGSDVNDDESDDHMIKLDALEQEVERTSPPKGLMGMKFMQNAVERQKIETKDMIRQVRELEQEMENEESQDEESDEVANNETTIHERDGDISNDGKEDYNEDHRLLTVETSRPITVGTLLKPLFRVEPFEIRDQYQKTYTANINDTIQFAACAVSSNDECSSENDALQSEHSAQEEVDLEEKEEKEQTSNANPWLADDISVPLQKSFKSASADPSSKAIAKIQKHKKKLESSIEYGIIQPDSNLNEELSNSEDNQPEIACDSQTSDHVQSDSDEDSDENHEDLDLFQPANIKSLTHSDIMKMTFENDNVVEEFEDEKKKIIERDLPKKEDLTLPGWGSWGGIGMKPPKEKVTREIPGIESSKRKDSKLSHVIINEKRMKKAIQYLVPQIPHGFENRDQYERTIRMPIGKEWNSQNIYLENIAPKIQKKLGVAIQPLKFVSTSRKSGNSNRRKF